MSPPWLKLIRHHLRQHKLALTFPFVLGAMRQPIGASFDSENDALEAAHTLLTAFRDVPLDSEIVRIYTCPDLGQPVFTVTRNQYVPGYEAWGVKRPAKLSVDPPFISSDPNDVYAVTRLLWPHISRPLLEARYSYSRTTHAYEPFSDIDRTFILDALAYDEENEL